MTQKTGANAPSNQFLTANPLTNQLTANGAQYDANGNLSAYGTGSFAVSYRYDNENRLTAANPGGASQTLFGYDLSNQRVYQGIYNMSTATYSNEQIYFYGIDGKKLVVYNLQSSSGIVTLTATQTKLWFAGRLLTPEDRLQSQGKYFPYGEDRYNPNPANPANDGEKFTTYTRDAATGLDYAYQRYYSSQIGRFTRPDPFGGSARANTPQSWNRYAYVEGDPANGYDPAGLYYCAPDVDDSQLKYLSWCLPHYGILSGDGSTVSGGGIGNLGTIAMVVSFAAGIFQGGGGSGGSAPPAPVVKCDLQLYFQPVGNNSIPTNHTYIELQTSTNGVLGLPYYIEAGPVSKTTGKLSASPINTWLNSLDRSNPTSHAYGTKSTLEYDTGFSTSECAINSVIQLTERRYPQNKVTYNVPAPNSNSFTYSLLKMSGVTLPLLKSLDLVTGAPGWGIYTTW